METAIPEMSEKDLENSIAPIVEETQALKIQNNNDYVRASRFLVMIGEATKRVDAYWKPMIEKAYALHRELTGKKNQFLVKLSEARVRTQSAIDSYDREQERIRQEAELKAREKAEAEEAKQRAKLAERAAKEIANGNDEKADELLQKAEEVRVPTPIIPTMVPKVEGLKKVTRWYAIVEDKAKVPDAFKVIDQAALNRHAQASKGGIPIPGVIFRSETTTERTGRSA